MAYYTDVSVLVGRTVVGKAPRADVGLPDQHALIITNMAWTAGNRNCLQYLEAACEVKAMGPANTPVSLQLTISGIMADQTTVHLD